MAQKPDNGNRGGTPQRFGNPDPGRYSHPHLHQPQKPVKANQVAKDLREQHTPFQRNGFEGEEAGTWTPGTAGTLDDLNPDRPREDPGMSRLVSKASCPNPDDLATWLRYETGGYVTMVGIDVVDRGLYWEIQVTSPDGVPPDVGAAGSVRL
jgi:hypothetical protein